MKKYQVSIITSITLLIATYFSITHKGPFFYIFLVILGSILGFYILYNSKYLRLSLLILTSIFWSSGLIIILSAIFALLSLPVSSLISWISSFLVILLTLIKPIKIEKSFFKIKILDIYLILFTLSSLYAYVLTIKNYDTPILHDPIAHAVWSKEIFKTGRIDYFYSPGLHILTALSAGSIKEIPNQILILTNTFCALSFIPIYLFIKDFFKSKRFAIFSSTLFILGSYPAMFYVTAGKNALVFAISYMFLLLFLASAKIPRIRKIIVLNCITFAIILIHYPTAAIALIGATLIIYSQKRFKGILDLIFGCLGGIIWGIIKMKYQVEHIAESVSSGSTSLIFNKENLITFSKGIYTQILPQFYSFYDQVILSVGIIGIIVITIIAIKKRNYRSFILFFYFNIATMFALEFIEKLQSMHIVYLTQILTLFIFIYIGSAFIFSEIIDKRLRQIDKKFKYLIYPTVLLFIFTGTNKISKTYKTEQEAKSMVTAQDVKSFEWINTNLNDEYIILNNAAIGHRKNVVYASDAGAWIPVFTDNNTAMPFSEFSSKNTHENYKIYQKIINNEYTCQDIEQLLDKNIHYYYQGSKGVYGGQINPNQEEQVNFQLLYQFKSARLFEIIPCNE